jgi:hypothetical protein
VAAAGCRAGGQPWCRTLEAPPATFASKAQHAAEPRADESSPPASPALEAAGGRVGEDHREFGRLLQRSRGPSPRSSPSCQRAARPGCDPNLLGCVSGPLGWEASGAGCDLGGCWRTGGPQERPGAAVCYRARGGGALMGSPAEAVAFAAFAWAGSVGGMGAGTAPEGPRVSRCLAEELMAWGDGRPFCFGPRLAGLCCGRPMVCHGRLLRAHVLVVLSAFGSVAGRVCWA